MPTIPNWLVINAVHPGCSYKLAQIASYVDHLLFPQSLCLELRIHVQQQLVADPEIFLCGWLQCHAVLTMLSQSAWLAK